VPEHETCRYFPAPDDMFALGMAYTIYMQFGDLASALRIALLLDEVSRWWHDYLLQHYLRTCSLAVEDSKRHLSGSGFDSQWERISRSELKKSPRCVLPALRLRLLCATLRLGNRCRVSSCRQPVSYGRPGFEGFLNRDLLVPCLLSSHQWVVCTLSADSRC
jgi:hypothetical protein